MSVSSIFAYPKYGMTIPEAAEYFGISEDKIRDLIYLNPYENFYLKYGHKTLIKRPCMEEYLKERNII